MIFPALLYKKKKNKTVRCEVCEKHCLISPNQTGYCGVRKNIGGNLYVLNYGLVAAAANDPIEKKPVFHFYPGSTCFSIGTLGCNFRCRFCQNWDIAYARLQTPAKQTIKPEAIIATAGKEKAQGVAITYNEPTIWLEYALQVMKIAKKVHLYTVWATNGYATQKTIDLIAPYLDVWRVDFKSLDDHFYQKMALVPYARPIFQNTLYLRQRYPQIHIECVTNIIPQENDSPENIEKIAHWIVKNLGPQTPWHITRFFPAAQMEDTPPTPSKTLIQAQKIAQKAGLQFVYLGNITTSNGANTYCPQCSALCIKRNGYQTQIIAVGAQGHCSHCGADLNIKMPHQKTTGLL